MRIADDQKHHGAALLQIAEGHPRTSIASFWSAEKVLRGAYRVNRDTAIYLKYGNSPVPPYDEYRFTFKKNNLDCLRRIRRRVQKVYLCLVCVRDREICCLPYEQFKLLIEARRLQADGRQEPQYHIICALKPKKQFQVYVNHPAARKHCAEDPIRIPRTDFPRRIFEL